MLATRPRGHDHEGREPSQAGGLRLAGLFSRYAGGGKLRTSHDSNDVAEQANPPVIMARVRAHGTLATREATAEDVAVTVMLGESERLLRGPIVSASL